MQNEQIHTATTTNQEISKEIYIVSENLDYYLVGQSEDEILVLRDAPQVTNLNIS